MRMPSGSPNIDKFLGGGFEYGIITQIYGASGTGKTNICTQLAVQCIRSGKKAVLIDTEGFSAERFSQIAGKDAKQLASELIIYEPKDFRQQYSAITDIEKIVSTGIGLIIVDSAILFYRFGLGPNDNNNANARRQLVEQLAGLYRLARKYNIVVMITNQVYTDPETGDFVPLGGNLIEHISKTIIMMERTGVNKRMATLIKHRSREEGEKIDMVITSDGIF